MGKPSGRAERAGYRYFHGKRAEDFNSSGCTGKEYHRSFCNQLAETCKLNGQCQRKVAGPRQEAAVGQQRFAAGSHESLPGSIDVNRRSGKGQLVFSQHCAICHQIGGKNGVSYGPDLATIRNRRPESIMADILDPNLSIADGYDIWNIELKSGEALQGLIATETPSAITIRNYGGVETIIARSDIQTLTAMGTSVMTAGFDQLINKQEMADLLAYLGR